METTVGERGPSSSPESVTDRFWRIVDSLPELTAPAWRSVDSIAVASLILLWALLFAAMWGHWGDLTIDCGREMYVPAELARGKTLYTDLWYPYTPGGPYLNSFLFRIFGIHLNVLYWAGALSALGSALFLYLAGLRVASRPAAWTTAAVILIQSFGFTIFCFPLPYSSGAVYACLAACVCIWLVLKACEQSGVGQSSGAAWMCAAGITAALALIMKQEIGAGCFIALGLFAVLRGFRNHSIRRAAIDFMCLVPGIVMCLAVIGWMISLNGPEFITQANLTSWPTSYFMRRYGPLWLANTGLALTGKAWLTALELLLTVAFWFGLRRILVRDGARVRMFWLGILMIAVLVVVSPFSDFVHEVMDALFFPLAAVFLIALAIPIAASCFWRRRFSDPSLKVLVLFLLSALIASRTLFGTRPFGYPIFYDGPVLLSFFVIMSWFLHTNRSAGRARIKPAELLPYLGALLATAVYMGPSYAKAFLGAPLVTQRGTIYGRADTVEAYRAVLAFIHEKKPGGATFLSLPEDMSLYFLAGIDCPTRFYQLHPGVLEPGKTESELIRQLRAEQVTYLIWSNRRFDNYGTPVFGVDFDQAVGHYLTTHYRRMAFIGFGNEASLLPHSKFARFIETHFGERLREPWRAIIWERVDESSTHSQTP